MSWPGLAVAIHVLGVVWWLGGVAFVTLAFLPALRHDATINRSALLMTIEHRFAPQARIALVLVGLSGGYLLVITGLWHVLPQMAFWWLDAMIAYWFVFILMLFVIEPLGILRRVVFSGNNPERGWRRFHTMHVVLLAAGVIITAAAAAGSHGY